MIRMCEGYVSLKDFGYLLVSREVVMEDLFEKNVVLYPIECKILKFYKIIVETIYFGKIIAIFAADKL